MIKYQNGSKDLFNSNVAESKPEENNEKSGASDIAKNYLSNIIHANSRGILSLTNFKKVNGIQKDVFGQKIYEVEYEVYVEFLSNGFAGGNNLIGYFNDFSVVASPPSSMYGTGTDNFGNNYKPYPKGQNVRFTGTVTLENTDNGYRHMKYGVSTYTLLDRPPKLDTNVSQNNSSLMKKFVSGYDGGLKDGKKDGFGKNIYQDGAVYEGDWKNDKRDGKGSLTDIEGNKYTGEWKNDKKEGEGMTLMKSSAENISRVTVKGIFKDDKFYNGIMTMFFTNGTVYESVMKDGVYGKAKKVKY